MKPLITFMLLTLCSAAMCTQTSAQTKNKGSKQSESSMYSCPMHPDMVSNTPGLCSRCDTKLVLQHEGSKALVHSGYSCIMHPAVVSDQPGTCNKCNKKLILERTGSKQSGVVSYSCPMHPDVVSNKPGKCPKCGMALQEKKDENDSSKMKMRFLERR